MLRVVNFHLLTLRPSLTLHCALEAAGKGRESVAYLTVIGQSAQRVSIL